MRPRWHDWVIVASILVLAATGVMAIWGDDLRELVRGPGRAAAGPSAPRPAPPPPPSTLGPI